MKLTNGKAEQVLKNLISEWEKEGDINGKTLNTGNLERLTRANLLAVQFFSGVDDAEFTLGIPSRIHSTTSTDIVCQIMEYERAKDGSSEKADILQELMTIVDYFSVSPVSPASIHIRYTIDNMWSE